MKQPITKVFCSECQHYSKIPYSIKWIALFVQRETEELERCDIPYTKVNYLKHSTNYSTPRNKNRDNQCKDFLQLDNV